MEGHLEAVRWVSVGSATNAVPCSISVMFITGEKEGLNYAAFLE